MIPFYTLHNMAIYEKGGRITEPMIRQEIIDLKAILHDPCSDYSLTKVANLIALLEKDLEKIKSTN